MLSVKTRYTLAAMVSRTMLLCALMAGCGGDPVNRGPFVVEPLNSPAGPGSSEAHLATGTNGTVVMSWLEIEGRRAALRFSTLTEGQWRVARTVSQGDNWFLNWADFPSVEPIKGDLWAAHWLVKRPGGVYAYDVAVALSNDGGNSWSAPITPHRDGTRTEHGFVTLFPWQSGVGAIWLDGRNMVEDDGSAGERHGHGGGMTVRSAVIGPGLGITHEALIDALVCDCCQTDVALVAGEPIVVYRDRSPAEIRDISVALGRDGSWSSSAPVAVDNWHIGGCPVNGPAIASRGTTVAVIWFTATAERATRVKMAFSLDGGPTFEPAITVDDQRPMGRVDVVMLDKDNAVVSWLRRSGEGKAELRIRKVSTAGELGPMRVVTETAASRPSGFPQMALAENHLILAWTDTSGASPEIRTARVDPASL